MFKYTSGRISQCWTALPYRYSVTRHINSSGYKSNTLDESITTAFKQLFKKEPATTAAASASFVEVEAGVGTQSISGYPPDRKYQLHAYHRFNIEFLGSGGSTASKHRGTPCIAINLGPETLLFDAGEGSLRQSLQANSKIGNTNHIFVTHMHHDHVGGLIGVILMLTLRTRTYYGDIEAPPLCIYGPQGLHKYISHNLRMTESTLKRAIIVHEFVVSSGDVKRVWGNNPVPWKKGVSAYTSSLHMPDQSLITNCKHKFIYPNDKGYYTCVDDKRLTIKAGLVDHSVPCFAYAVEESNIIGTLLLDKCKELQIPVSMYMDLKNGEMIRIPQPPGYKGNASYIVKQAQKKNRKRGIAKSPLIRNILVKPSDVLGPYIRGRKVVIVGDTFNATNIIPLALDCDVLVHEASYVNEKLDQAIMKGHATPAIATKLANICDAKRLVLNHISSKFLPYDPETDSYDSKNPIISDADKSASSLINQPLIDNVLHVEAAASFPSNHVVVARDYMYVSVPLGGYCTDNEFPIFKPPAAVPSAKTI